MRNILIFPDGSRQDFQYPANRDVVVGEQLQVQMKDDSIRVLTVYEIEQHPKEIHFLLKE